MRHIGQAKLSSRAAPESKHLSVSYVKRNGAPPYNVSWILMSSILRDRAIAILAAFFLLASGSSLAAPDAKTTAAIPIRHVIIIMQENRSFDSYFGTFPGAEGIPADACVPGDPKDP